MFADVQGDNIYFMIELDYYVACNCVQHMLCGLDTVLYKHVLFRPN